MRKGIAYGVGVGPGDPELMTLKACRLIRECDVIALPGKAPAETLAYRIAAQAVEMAGPEAALAVEMAGPEAALAVEMAGPEAALAGKELLAIDMPMSMDREVLKESHRSGAALIEEHLAQGKDVVFLTLGDPCVYSTFTYLKPYLEADGYETVLVNGVPSFCAAAARLNIPLVEWDEPMHVIPAMHKLGDGAEREAAVDLGCEAAVDLEQPGVWELERPGTCVLMKSGRHMREVKELLDASGKKAVQMVQDCGMDSEQVYRNLNEIPDDAGYFSLIIAKDGKP